MKIPLLNLKKQYAKIQSEIQTAIQKILDQQSFILGEDVNLFEQEFAAYHGEDFFCASCNSGTDALLLALKAYGIGPGDEVIVPSHTFFASCEVITLLGATVRFIDVAYDTMLIDYEQLPSLINSQTKAIMAVHLYGQSCNMNLLRKVADEHNLILIEDAAQAQGARWDGKSIGSLSDVACYSFFPGKNLGAYGDAGAIISKNKEQISRLRAMRNHGRYDKFNHQFIGVSSRLDTIQAAVLRVKLRHLDSWNASRKRHAKAYFSSLKGITLPYIDPKADSVFHQFVIRSKDRDVLKEKLQSSGISTGIHYPIPVHSQIPYQNVSLHLPVTEQICREILSIPICPQMIESEREQICDLINEFALVSQ